MSRPIDRRRVLLAGAAALAATWPAHAQQRASLADPLRVGVDQALVDSGLANALRTAFGRDTGVAVRLQPGPALALLEALERGEVDATLTNAPEAETRLAARGLAHDRQPVAEGGLVLVGPAPTRKTPDPAGIARMDDVAAALAKLRDAALAGGSGIVFLSAGDGSGTHLAEQALWRTAQVAPGMPWYRKAAPGALPAQARQEGTYALVERGVWARHGGAPLAVLVQGDARMALPVHVMRSFRVSHPAGKLFVAWISGRKGRAVVAAQRGYRVPA